MSSARTPFIIINYLLITLWLSHCGMWLENSRLQSLVVLFQGSKIIKNVINIGLDQILTGGSDRIEDLRVHLMLPDLKENVAIFKSLRIIL